MKFKLKRYSVDSLYGEYGMTPAVVLLGGLLLWLTLLFMSNTLSYALGGGAFSSQLERLGLLLGDVPMNISLPSPQSILATQMVVMLVSYALPAVVMAAGTRDIRSELGFKHADGWLVYAFAVGIGFALLIVNAALGVFQEQLHLEHYFSWYAENSVDTTLLVDRMMDHAVRQQPVWAHFNFVVIITVSITVFFHGWLGTTLHRIVGRKWLAALLSGLFFSAVQLNLTGTLPLVAVGFVFCYSFLLTRSIWVPMLIAVGHELFLSYITWNSLHNIPMPYVKSYVFAPHWFVVLPSIALICGFLWYASRRGQPDSLAPAAME